MASAVKVSLQKARSVILLSPVTIAAAAWSKRRMWKRERKGKLYQGHKGRARATILETNL